jgi:hypothetical protein
MKSLEERRRKKKMMGGIRSKIMLTFDSLASRQ